MDHNITEKFEHTSMYFLRKLGSLFLILTFFSSCSGDEIPDLDWPSAVSANTPFVIIPAEQSGISAVLQSPYIPFLEDITSSAIQLVSQVDSEATAAITVKAVLLHPGTANRLQPVWVTEAPANYIDELQNRFHRSFTQNKYFFKDATVHRLHLQDRVLFACQLHDLLLISESSLGIEDAVRTYLGSQPAADLSDAGLQPGSVVMNTPSLDKWVEQLSQVIYRPSVKGAFEGTKPAVLQVSAPAGDEQSSGLQFSGTLPLAGSQKSELIAAISEKNAPVRLDRYISSNAAAFGLFRMDPSPALPSSGSQATALDSTLMENESLYTDIAQSLQSEFALVTYAQSGFLSTGEHLFIRTLGNRSALQAALNKLERDKLIQRIGNTYTVSSRLLAQLIGSGLSTFRDFYLSITGDAVVISQRRGLAEGVASDRSRRRVIYYEQNYMDIKEHFPDDVSGLFVISEEFDDFITPFLAPGNYTDAITSKFDFLTISTRLDPAGESLAFNLATYTSEETSVPYREQWLFSTGGTDLSGNPVLADIGGSARNEIIFATESGRVYTLAADGTVVMQANTGEDTPVGSPVVYDWYGTGQNVILIAAGNKIYGWNDTGEPLPRFPFELDEQITTPLTISDIDRNGLPEAIVATEARKLHALDGRGNNLKGWPLTTNALIQTKPLIEHFRGSLSVLAFSENAVHAWNSNGTPRSGFPKFVDASLRGSPAILEGNVLGGAADGYLYSVGNNITFADSLNVYDNMSDSSDVGAVYVSNSSLTGSPSLHDLAINTETSSYSGPAILTMSDNGSVFLLSEDGRLLFNQNMGQPGAPGSSPLITDINSDNIDDIVALADYGRLYAWSIAGGERIYSIPTSGIDHFIIEDIDGDGYKELIAQTSEGIRCWTIYGE